VHASATGAVESNASPVRPSLPEPLALRLEAVPETGDISRPSSRKDIWSGLACRHRCTPAAGRNGDIETKLPEKEANGFDFPLVARHAAIGGVRRFALNFSAA
jgi:hypothetical protein